MFSYEYCEFFKNTYFEEHLWERLLLNLKFTIQTLYYNFWQIAKNLMTMINSSTASVQIIFFNNFLKNIQVEDI